MLAWGFILLGSLAWLGAAQPIDTDVEAQWLVRERRSPMAARRIIPIRELSNSGVYHYERLVHAFNPQTAMAAYATGDTVAAGSFYRSPSMKQECANCDKLVDEQPEAPQPDSEEPKSAEEPAPQEQEIPAQVDDNKEVVVTHPKPKVPKGRPIEDEEDDEDDDDDDDDDYDDDYDSVARKGGKRGGSTYTNFFPINFGAKLRVARGTDDDGENRHGDVRSISNSFSTGRGAISSSSAKAYPSPNTSQKTLSQLRN